MTAESFEYFEGVKTTQHEDGSTTYVTTYHEPYVEPLTPKQSAAVIGGLVVGLGVVIAMPFWLERAEEWSSHRAEVRRLKKAQKIQNLKDQTKD